MRIRCLFLFSIFTIVLVNPSVAQESLIILNSSDLPTMSQNIKYIESLGGTITHRFPPHILIGDIPSAQLNNLTGNMNIVEISTKPVNASSVSIYGRTTEIAVDVWNNNFIAKAGEVSLISANISQPGPIIGDMLYVPENATSRSKGKLSIGSANSELSSQTIPYGAGFFDTSEYMMGDVAVGIIFLESNGVIDPNSQDWTGTEESNVVRKIQAGLNWWIVREPEAKLTFTYDIHYKVPTRYEPITRSGYSGSPSGESLWIEDAMTNLGYTNYPSFFTNVYDYDNSIRKMLNTDWAYAIFVLDSSNDADGKFSDGNFAYAYLGGPFSVMTYTNDGYGIANMDAVIAHETGHIFYAIDQYAEANSPCTQIAGYLAIQNQNSAYPFAGACLSNVDSIMRSQVSPYINGAIDTYARQQIGWKDTDVDGIQDIIDFSPVSILNVYSPDPTENNTPTYTGISSTITTYPNNNPSGSKNAMTINKIKKVQYRVDGSSWINASPVDGIFDSSIEDFTFTTSPLSYGAHTFEVRALNTAGNWETVYSNDTLIIGFHKTITVDESGGDDYTKIQDAINHSNPGDTILVQSGTYYENVNVTKQLILRGRGVPVVDARGSGSAITLSADGIILEGLTATGGYSEAGIKITSNNNKLIGNNVSNNGYGITLKSSNNNTIYNNIFNNTNDVQFIGSNVDVWNITRQSGMNIISGSYLGGNYWAFPNGTGFSQQCEDNSRDGICDSAYVLDIKNIDYLPLAYPTSINLIKNPGFENGTMDWSFYTSGIGTFTAVSPGYAGLKSAKIAINNPGTNTQIYQIGITLEPNTCYRLIFSAKSTIGNDLSVELLEHVSPFTNYGLYKEFDITSSWKEFSTEFTTSGFTNIVDDGRLKFWLASFSQAGDVYYIDNVSLEKI